MSTAETRRVMVVDDSRLQCAVWRKLLEERYGDKVAVETYTDPEEAVPGMAPDIHLLLLDWEMPEMDGIELARRIHEDPALNSTKIIMLTSAAAGEDAARVQQVVQLAEIVHVRRERRIGPTLME